MEKVLIFADPGVDDGFALLYALNHPDITVTGIVADYGNVSQEDALKNITFLLDLTDQQQIPVIVGAKRPLSGNPPEYFYDIHGVHGLGFVVPDKCIQRIHPFQKIYQIIDQYRSELTIISLARLTSLALAFIQAESNVTKVKQTLLMGGAFLVPGNRTPLAEANIYGDPHAAATVISNSRNTTLLPLNVSNRAIIPDHMIESIAKQASGPYSSILIPMIRYYSKQYEKILPDAGGAPLHDLIVFSYLMHPEYYQVVHKQVEVVTAGPSKGLTYADFRAAPEKVPGSPVHTIALDFNKELFLDDIMKVLA
ncbi:nucleoside hydrolase [Halobacillus sp. KGW1]|uniref:nucleoside hydrolase n=1 Tax=Halobacillus sp. KGW1 TaxID=1793726 RepID=UPI000781EB59|nr:nucleoside hydrolase [Halobacillus sp. KGW1]